MKAALAKSVTIEKIGGIQVKKLGNVILAESIAPITFLHRRAAKRLAEISTLADWRARSGVVSDPDRWMRVTANAIATLNQGRPWGFAGKDLDRQFRHILGCPDDRFSAALRAARRERGLLSGLEAGKLIDFTVVEMEEIQRETGKVFSTLLAHDETSAARALRRAQRRREMSRKRMQKHRKLKEIQRSKCVTGPECNIAPLGYAGKYITSVTSASATFRPGSSQAARIIAALRGGASSIAQISDHTGLSRSSLAPLLSRLKRAGMVVDVARGAYALTEETGQ